MSRNNEKKSVLKKTDSDFGQEWINWSKNIQKDILNILGRSEIEICIDKTNMINNK